MDQHALPATLYTCHQMKNKPWKPTGLQKFNKFCMAVNEDHKSLVAGTEVRGGISTKKKPSKERNFAREMLVLLPLLPNPPAVVWHQSRAISM
jgi:hypothetical protein